LKRSAYNLEQLHTKTDKLIVGGRHLTSDFVNCGCNFYATYHVYTVIDKMDYNEKSSYNKIVPSQRTDRKVFGLRT